ncbi:MAG TPA: GlsB/YeaQ/YmgE family stress response membrane protein [Candidatus Limnocylindria bacterium]|jgi:uncharacterized membrane protein YeaQ/YmgE (transglycosylase-associated protein family)|nr:GlsB/YeaQ/YmgE family stress response membrane protein [Candidatus Limnocylindria bacterium]
MGIIAWIVLGAIAGWLAGLLVKGDEGMGIIMHIILGIVGGLIGGWIVAALTGTNFMDKLDIGSIIVAVIGAVVLVVVVNMVQGRTRTGSGPI